MPTTIFSPSTSKLMGNPGSCSSSLKSFYDMKKLLPVEKSLEAVSVSELGSINPMQKKKKKTSLSSPIKN